MWVRQSACDALDEVIAKFPGDEATSRRLADLLGETGRARADTMWKTAEGDCRFVPRRQQKPGLEVRDSIPDDLPTLMLDPQRMRQIAFNLMGNASKFTHEGHIELKASFTPSAEDPKEGLFRVDVEDAGCGISEEDLKRMGDFEIVEAENGKIAFDILRSEGAGKFDLVLTDMWMPEMDGEGLVDAIRADADIADMKVFVLTTDVEMRDTYADMGFTGFVLKPVTFDTLKAVFS